MLLSIAASSINQFFHILPFVIHRVLHSLLPFFKKKNKYPFKNFLKLNWKTFEVSDVLPLPITRKQDRYLLLFFSSLSPPLFPFLPSFLFLSLFLTVLFFFLSYFFFLLVYRIVLSLRQYYSISVFPGMDQPYKEDPGQSWQIYWISLFITQHIAYSFFSSSK